MTRWRTAPPGYGVREAKRERGLVCLREAADVWARDGRAALSDQLVLSVLFRVFASPERYRQLQLRGSTLPGDVPALPVRPLEEWQSTVGTPSDEIANLSNKMSAAAVRTLTHACLDLIGEAASEWALGDPERPTTEVVFLRLARLLDSQGLIPW